MFVYVVSRSPARAAQRTANNKLLWPVLEGLRFAGADVGAVLRKVGLDEETAFALDTRVDLEQLFGLWREAVEITHEPALGVRVAAFTEPSNTISWPMPLSLFEHLGMVSPSLADAVPIQNRFLRLLRDGLQLALELDGERAILRLDPLPEAPAAVVEHDFAVTVNVARRAAKRDVPLLEVWFAHRAPPHAHAHAKLFKAPVRFGAPFNAVIARADELTRPLATANETFRARIVRQAERLLAALPCVDLFEDKVCVRIEAELPDGNTNASAVAETLGVSSRTLHRRLQHEGASYQELLDRVRLRLAVRHLSAGKAIAEVASLVGFAQASTFHRAFKSWTGETPADYQLRSRHPAGVASQH